MKLSFALHATLHPALRWTLLLLPLELGWEVAHLPLYTSWHTKRTTALGYDVLHCTAGDALIAFASYLAVAMLLRASDWPRTAALRGLLLATALGTAYTIGSEWVHLRAGDWAYEAAMPRVAGIGVSPLLQWLVLPALGVLLYRAQAKGTAR